MSEKASDVKLDPIVDELQHRAGVEGQKRFWQCSSLGGHWNPEHPLAEHPYAEVLTSEGERAWALHIASRLVEACPGEQHRADWKKIKEIAVELLDSAKQRIR